MLRTSIRRAHCLVNVTGRVHQEINNYLLTVMSVLKHASWIKLVVSILWRINNVSYIAAKMTEIKGKHE